LFNRILSLLPPATILRNDAPFAVTGGIEFIAFGGIMRLSIYHPESRRVFRGERATVSKYGHTFGGDVRYAGLAAGGQPPVHLLLRLNLQDPAVGLALPGTRWLPLLCAIRYGACNLGYRVISDSEVKILHQSETEAWEDFPYEGYPELLPPEPIALSEASYDPGNPRDALRYAGVFGYDALSEDQFADLARFVVDEGLFDPEFMEGETPEEYLREGVGFPFVQGPPDDDCPEPTCQNHGREASLRTLAIFSEDEERVRRLWGPNGEDLQIIYQICPNCDAIRATNQCT
jgi:hypothetical protein